MSDQNSDWPFIDATLFVIMLGMSFANIYAYDTGLSGCTSLNHLTLESTQINEPLRGLGRQLRSRTCVHSPNWHGSGYDECSSRFERAHRIPDWLHATRSANCHDVVQDLRLHYYESGSVLHSGSQVRYVETLKFCVHVACRNAHMFCNRALSQDPATPHVPGSGHCDTMGLHCSARGVVLGLWTRGGYLQP